MVPLLFHIARVERIGPDQLRYLAVMALDEIADSCGDAPAPRSAALRFTLAFLWRESGSDPAKRWLFDSFWTAATSAAPLGPHKEMLDRYTRSTAMEAALNSICRELGWERTVTFMQEMKARRAPRR